MPGQGEHPVSQVCFRRGTEPDDRFGLTDPGHFVLRGPGRVHQAPAGAQRGVDRQPLDGSRPPVRQAFFHFEGLFGHMDVNRSLRVFGEQLQRPLHLALRAGSQTVDTPAQAHLPSGARACLPLESLRERGQPVRIHGESSLRRLQWTTVESCLVVDHRDMDQVDSRPLGGADDPAAHLRRVCVGGPVGLVMQVVKLPDRGESSSKQLDVELRRSSLHHLGTQVSQVPVHDLAPLPEGVGPAPFGSARQASLECMAMNVGHPGNRPTRHASSVAAFPWTGHVRGPVPRGAIGDPSTACAGERYAFDGSIRGHR